MKWLTRLKKDLLSATPNSGISTGLLPVTDYSERLAKAKADLGVRYLAHPQSEFQFVGGGPVVLQRDVKTLR